MSVAAIYDIHGNLPALEAVLNEINTLSVDLLIVGGDVIIGPMSVECLDLLINFHIPTQFNLGNCETAVLAQLDNRLNLNLPETVISDIEWTAKQLRPDHQKVIAGWPKTFSVDIDGLGTVLFCHATPRDENENFTRITSEEKISAAFQTVNQSIVICGHTHMQFDRKLGNLRIVNAGSVGMPFAKTGADWLLLGPEIKHMHTDYDLQTAADRIRKTDYPNKTDFIENYLFNPPSEQEMLSILS